MHAVQMLPEQEWPDVTMVPWQVLVGWPHTGRAVALTWQALPAGVSTMRVGSIFRVMA